MFYLFVFLFFRLFCEARLRANRLHGWDYINLHCRDNENTPVDWWMIYKPPSGILPWDLGLNFSYITSAEAGKWVPSKRLITGDSMLKHTMAPLYRRTYQDHLALAAYAPKPRSHAGFGSVARGLLMADEFSGLWLSHTVPGLPDFSHKDNHKVHGDRLYFPEEELKNGHIIVCLSADFATLNDLSRKLREMEPQVVAVQVPPGIKELLPDWLPMGDPVRVTLSSKFVPKALDYVTKEKTLRAEVIVRRPGERRCLYQTFAKMHSIVLDVYGHHKAAPTVCKKSYGVRKIDSISLNFPNNINEDIKRPQVIYIDNQTDLLEFAVSTAAPWQYSGGNENPEYWTCVGSTTIDDGQGDGGIILCIEDYEVWRSFDILKIREPSC